MKVRMGAKELVEMGRTRCKPGEILREGFTREGYTRKDGVRVGPTRVGPACVPDKGAPGKTPAARRFAEFGPPGKSYLPGWAKDVVAGTRHAALRRMTEREGCFKVQRKLLQLANVTTDAPTKARARADRNWLVRQGFCKLKTKER